MPTANLHMTNEHYRDYRTLGVEPGCTWHELRSAYRRLVQTTHPDRFVPESRDKELAEEKLKTINRAFQNLANYRQHHGTLPNLAVPDPDIRTSAESAADMRSPADTARNDPYNPRETRIDEEQIPQSPDSLQNQNARLRTVLLWAGAILVMVAFFVDEIWTTSPEEALVAEVAQRPVPLAQTATPLGAHQAGTTTASAPGKYFTVGSSMGEVYDVQGIPTATEEGVWHYGNSKVFFNKGAVSSWEQNPPPLLKADLHTGRRDNVATSFTIGSSKPDVRSAQGTPLFENENVWDYGSSKVYFRDGKVSAWDNSPLRPLQLHR